MTVIHIIIVVMTIEDGSATGKMTKRKEQGGAIK